MILTIENNRETIRRYAHLERRPSWTPACSIECHGTRYTCTRERGHRGPHATHRWFRRVVAVWDSGPADRVGAKKTGIAAEKGSTSTPRRRRPVGLRAGRNGFLDRLRSAFARVLGSGEEIAFLLLFGVFVWFAVVVLRNLH